MKKCLLTIIATVAMTTAFAQPESGQSANINQRRDELMKELKQSLNLTFSEQGNGFQLDVATKGDMPTAADLEIASITVMKPTGPVPGLLAITTRTGGEAQIQMVGPQKGKFAFMRGQLPEGLPNGRYLLTINGEVYGMLVITPDKIMLRQGLKPDYKNDGSSEAPVPQPTVPSDSNTMVPQPTTPMTAPQPVNTTH